MLDKIEKLGKCSNADENWSLLREILSELFKKPEIKEEKVEQKKKGKK